MLVGLAWAIVLSSLASSADAAVPGGPPPAADRPFTLWGNASSGWGFSNTSITQPGPTITVTQGDNVIFTLFSGDGLPHILVIDLNSDDVKQGNEPASNQFNSDTTPVTFTYTAAQAGTFQYFCQIHGAAAQNGTLTVESAGGGAPPADNTLLIVGGLVVVVAIVAVAALMMRKKPKPPSQPPAQ